MALSHTDKYLYFVFTSMSENQKHHEDLMASAHRCAQNSTGVCPWCSSVTLTPELIMGADTFPALAVTSQLSASVKRVVKLRVRLSQGAAGLAGGKAAIHRTGVVV